MISSTERKQIVDVVITGYIRDYSALVRYYISLRFLSFSFSFRQEFREVTPDDSIFIFYVRFWDWRKLIFFHYFVKEIVGELYV